MLPSGHNPIVIISGQYNAFNTGYNACGVYGFSGVIESSSFELPLYVGSAADFKKRIFYEHTNDLKANRHPNHPLQNYYNKNGTENIICFEFQKCEETELINMEQGYLDHFGTAKDRKCFNICDKAGRPPSGKGRKMSEEQRLGIKKRFSGSNHPNYGKKHSQETIQKMREYAQNRKISEETREKLRKRFSGEKNPNWGKKRPQYVIDAHVKAHAKPFKIVSPSGELFEGINLAKFAREKGLRPANLGSVIAGKAKQYKGWTKYQN
jgi:group I intron endonuclease